MMLEPDLNFRNRLVRKKTPEYKKESQNSKVKSFYHPHTSLTSSCSDPFLNDENNKNFWRNEIRKNNKNLEDTLYVGIDESGDFVKKEGKVMLT